MLDLRVVVGTSVTSSKDPSEVDTGFRNHQTLVKKVV